MSKRLISAQWHKAKANPPWNAQVVIFFFFRTLFVSQHCSNTKLNKSIVHDRTIFFNLAMLAHPKISAWLQCVVSCPWCCPWSWWSRRDWKGLEGLNSRGFLPQPSTHLTQPLFSSLHLQNHTSICVPPPRSPDVSECESLVENVLEFIWVRQHTLWH